MIRISAVLLSFLVVPSSYASMTSASIFKEMQSTNPGVISGRTAATFSALVKKDQITIEQSDLSAGPLGAGSSFESSIDIINYSAFYGGKGGGLTTEIFAETGSGGKNDKIIEPGNTVEYTTDSSLTNMSIGLGLFKGLGISLLKVDAEDSQNVTGTLGGSAININTTSETSVTGFTVGTAFNLGLDYGFFYQKADYETKTNAVYASGSGDGEISGDRVGLGVGHSNKVFRTEVGYVRNVKAMNAGDSGELTPSMIEFTAEAKLGKLKLGYTGRYMMDGFFLYRNILFNVLAYQGTNEARLDNTFNFSYGSDSKGHSFSGSVSIGTTESEQTQNLISSDNTKYKTVTSSKSFSLSYSYIF